ncbi:MAG: diadenylate cyclase CdaA [Candidatus Latescibacteria bacterium]|nr:diadenylate cyclase CdaA [Candidatus Latescibacterota bacterium]
MLDFLKPSSRDIIDIIIVAIIFFYFLRLLKGTRALRMMYALLFIFIGSFIASWLDLKALSLIVDSLKTVWVVVFVILFQPEIRNALARFGRARPLRFLLKPATEEDVINEIVNGAIILKERNYGGLIVIERQIGLRDIIETGTRIEARVSASLLVSIFTPASPLHDGACIISGDQVMAAACTLPLSEIGEDGKYWGMRHRAGIGITVVTDAISVIVSERSGRISYAEKGRILSDLTSAELRYNLTNVLLKK